MASETGSDLDCDVVIIGAGLSGLTAAYTLLKHDSNLKLRILEASDRIGGQILTKELKCGNGETDQFDFGAVWIHKDQKEINALLAELDIQKYPQYEKGKNYMELLDGKVKSYSGDNMPVGIKDKLDIYSYFSKAESASKAVNLENPQLSVNAADLDGTSVEDFRKKTVWTTGGGDLADMMATINHTMAPAHISKMEYLYVMKSCGGYEAQMGGDGSDFRVEGGMFQICQKLVTHIGDENIHTGEKVVSIVQEDGQQRALVKTQSGKVVSTKHVVVTVPPSNIVDIEFTPPFSIEFPPPSYSLGTISFVATYGQPFWRDAGFSGQHMSMLSILAQIRELPQAGPLTMVMDGVSSKGHAALFGTLATGNLKNLTLVTDKLKTMDERKAVVLTKLAEIFGRQAEQAIDYADHVWEPEEGVQEMSKFMDECVFFNQSSGRYVDFPGCIGRGLTSPPHGQEP
ncbi:probable flavin-containing monoamine oxidase A isoform X2 [Patiria miniata]|uniref:Amine oxidase n=1 Tax=Patiria miniata TaxID=46514 RepID=A0A913Z267_PATMI|nr:probable flavin-containing monoamine oxidase A isoform X2 [Patiria miniata]